MSNKITKAEYYKITLEKSLNIIVDADRCSRLFAESILEFLKKYKRIEEWGDGPLPDYMDAYLNAKVLKDFMEKKVKDPDERLMEYAAKNKISGVLLTKMELNTLQSLVNNLEETKDYLNKKYGFSTLLN